MIIGVPKEVKANEDRVALVPAGVESLVSDGHTVLVELGAGTGSGFDDQAYERAGATLIQNCTGVWGRAEMILKVKEPIESEWMLLKAGQVVFTYFHFAANEALTRAVIKSGAVAIAYETVQLPHGELPLLTPMSEVAGRMAVQEGAKYLERIYGGSGILLGGVPGVLPAEVLVLGGGVVGTNAAKVAAGMGASVTAPGPVAGSPAVPVRHHAGQREAPPLQPACDSGPDIPRGPGNRGRFAPGCKSS